MNKNHAARSRLFAITTAAALLGMAVGSAAATEASKDAVTKVEAGAPSMKVYIDPTTGKFRQPTAEELSVQERQTISSISASSSKGGGVIITKRADGTMRGLDTEGRLMESAIATVAPDGTMSIQYVNGDGSLAHAADAPANVAEEK